MKKLLMSLLVLVTIWLTACDFTAKDGGNDSISQSSEVVSNEESSIEEERIPSVGLEYTLSDGGLYYIVMGIGTCMDTEIVIPNIYNDLPIKEIGSYAFDYCYGLKEIVIPDSVENIDKCAFYATDSLTKVVIGDGVANIGNHAFWGCSGLTEIVIPDNVTSIGDYAFAYCGGLTEIVIPDGVEKMGNYTFRECKNLTSISMPDSVKSIGDFTFADCYNLTEIVIPGNVMSIGGYAFDGCIRLKSIAFKGTMLEWDMAVRGNTWNNNVPAKEIVCADGTVTL